MQWASGDARKTTRLRVSVRIAASLVALLLAFPSHAQQSDGGVVLDAPVVIHLANGHYDFNPAAFAKVNLELTRLQQVERVHQGEPSWAQPVIVGLFLGVVMGAALAAGADLLWERLKMALSSEF